MMVIYTVYCIALHVSSSLGKSAHPLQRPVQDLSYSQKDQLQKIVSGDGKDETGQTNVISIDMSQQKADNDKTQIVGKPFGEPEYYKSKLGLQEIAHPLEKPIDGSLPARIAWTIGYPIRFMCRLTIPDCRTEKYHNWYALTFFISMIWISFYSFFLVSIFYKYNTNLPMQPIS